MPLDFCYNRTLAAIIVENMPGPSVGNVRPSVRAGTFYPGEPAQCRAMAESCLRSAQATPARPWIGGIVPHAGWVFSGAIAGQTISAIASATRPDVIIIFGAIHTPIPVQAAALDSHQRWAVPTGESTVHLELEQKLREKGNLFIVDDRLHATEHAIEVNLPLVQLAFPGVPMVPIEVPVLEVAEIIGRKSAETVAGAGIKAIYLASSDLTHYGTNYGFMPAGVGLEAMAWAKDNDRRLLDLVTTWQTRKIIPEVRQRYNACGAGAIVAMMAACRQAGANDARVLQHTTSFEVFQSIQPQPPNNAVGYAAVVMG
jgi:MEMO1 family protein